MQKITFLAVGAALGLAVGVFASGTLLMDDHSHDVDMPTSTDSHDHADMVMHNHDAVAVLDIATAPTVEVMAIPDTKSGYNVRLITDNFTFTPDAAGGENVQGQGHAHIYVDDVKMARVYGEWVHLPAEAFTAGANTIRVTLNANDHSEWQVEGESIQAEVVVQN